MKKIYSLIIAFTFFIGFGSSAQTYSGWGVADANGTAYDTIVQYGDTLNFSFSGMPLGAFGSARLMVYFEGDFGDNGEFLNVYDQTVTTLIGASTNTTQGDCAPEDSSLVSFPGASLDTWQTAGNWSIALVPTNQVDFFCITLRVRVRLEYDYCIAGTPVQFASVVPDTNYICSHNTATFTVLPAGGTLTGPGVTGLTFNPSGFAPGVYTFSYTGTDAIGCTTSSSTTVTIGNSPVQQSYLVCEGGNSPVLGGSTIEYTYAYDVDFVNPLDTAIGYVYGPITQSPEVIYTSSFARTGTFTIDTITNDNVFIMDHDAITGDDRGGIAITDSTIYIVGDNATGRYNLDLTSPGVALPVMDGLFSDLAARKIWTLYNTTSASLPTAWSGAYTINAFAELNANLGLTGTNTPLSQPVILGNTGNDGIFAGYGKVGLYDGASFYVVDVVSGTVDSIGQFTMNLYGSENWLDWGNLGFNGVDYIAYYREWMNGQIVAHNLTTDIITEVTQLPGFSDMASFTFHPDNDRLYFHYEGSGNFGGTSETAGFIDASATIILNPNGQRVGCPSPIEFTFNTVDFGADTTICQADAPYVIEPGLGYNSYTWNGVNNNWNVYPVASTQTVIGSVVDASNCVLVDTITVTVESCASLNELGEEAYSIYPNPNNGTFNIQFGQSVDGASVHVVDTKGRVCHTETFSGTIQNAQVETTNLEKGIYFVTVTVNDKTSQATIVVQ